MAGDDLIDRGRGQSTSPIVEAGLKWAYLAVSVVHRVQGAVWEALRNDFKGAGVTTALVRAESLDGGVKVTVRAQGQGFDHDAVGPGFGLSQSVFARLAEVDRSVTVQSSLGRGTRITFWVRVA